MKWAWPVGVIIAALTAAGTRPAQAEAPGYWAAVAEEVCGELTKAETLAKAGKSDEAKGAVINAYFGVFEGKKMEIAERSQLGADHTSDLEDSFNLLRKGVARNDPAVPATAESLRKALRADGKALDAAKVMADGVGVAK